MAIAKVVQYRALSVEQLAENARVSQTATELARANERAEGERRAYQMLAEADARVAAAGGLQSLSKREVDQLWQVHMKALRLRGG
jgi:hypothetical protein